MTYFKPQTPQGDGNVRFSMQASGRLSFQTTNPARGRKLGDGRHLLLLDGEFQTTNPARGRKPIAKPAIEPSSGSNFKPQTPQGDGNLALFYVMGICRETFQTTNPARGRKRHCPQLLLLHDKISNHKPRKGTETSSLLLSQGLVPHFKPQTPQGDGNNHTQERFPRGTCHFKSQTPQGDGNYLS